MSESSMSRIDVSNWYNRCYQPLITTSTIKIWFSPLNWTRNVIRSLMHKRKKVLKQKYLTLNFFTNTLNEKQLPGGPWNVCVSFVLLA